MNSSSSGGKTRSKIWIFRGATLCATLLLVVFLLEVGLRLVYPQFGGCNYNDRDAELGWRLLPGYSGTCISRGHRTVSHIEISQQGFRSPPVEIPKPLDVRRILMLGDSMTFGSGIETTETTAAVLEAGLNRAKPELQRYEVINAAAPGYGTAQQWLLYRRWADDLAPDIVLLMFFVSNDLENNICHNSWETHPCFGLKNGELVLESTLPDEAAAGEGNPWRLKKLHTHVFFRTRLESLFMASPGIARLLPWLGYEAPLPGTLQSWYGGESFANSWKITHALLNALEADVRADGIPLVLVIVPSSAQATEEFEQLTVLLHSDTPEGAAFLANPLLPQETLIDWAEEHAVPAIDPLGLLKRTAAESSIYLPDRHFNALGSRMVAEEIQTGLTAMDQEDL